MSSDKLAMIEIVSDGSSIGTTIIMDGKKMDNVKVIEWKLKVNGIAELKLQCVGARLRMRTYGSRKKWKVHRNGKR